MIKISLLYFFSRYFMLKIVVRQIPDPTSSENKIRICASGRLYPDPRLFQKMDPTRIRIRSPDWCSSREHASRDILQGDGISIGRQKVSLLHQDMVLLLQGWFRIPYIRVNLCPAFRVDVYEIASFKKIILCIFIFFLPIITSINSYSIRRKRYLLYFLFIYFKE